MPYTMTMQPAIFLDLDNTIVRNDAPESDAVTLIQGAAPAIASLRGLGYRIIVVANQEGVARGTLTEDDVHALHSEVADLVTETANGAQIDAFYYCPFHPRGKVKGYKKDHPTRKPRPGMLLQASDELKIDLSASWMIGDELADVQAGHSAGTRTILLRPDAEQLMPVDPETIEGITTETPDPHRPTGPDFFAVNLVDAARLIAQQPRVDQHETKPQASGRKWDAEKIAKIQVPRPPQSEQPKQTAATSTKSFRPWGAPSKEDDAPIVTKPFRKRQHAEATAAQVETNGSAPTKPEQPSTPEIPENIRQAIQKKAEREQSVDSAEDEKTLRLILHELRTQRGQDQEFSFLTIIAVAMQLVAVICLLGGLFMGGGDDGLFLRWLGTGIMAQLTAIAVLLYGR